jgi:hypothetical protein
LLGGQEYGDDPLLPSVKQWLDWKLTNILPKAGGTLDQDPVFMRDLRAISGIEGKFDEIKKTNADMKARIAKLTEGR